MNEQAYLDIPTRHYLLQPGDGTSYRFAIGFLPKLQYLQDEAAGYIAPTRNGASIVNFMPVQEPDGDWQRMKSPYPIVMGIGNGQNYITLTITMPYFSGHYEVCLDSLRNLRSGYVNYLLSHMGLSRNYRQVVAAILLAVSILAFEPDNLIQAARAMLSWPDLIEKETEYALS